MSARRSSAARRAPRPGKAPLDRETVLRAGLEIANSEDIEAVTFRRVAEELSVTPMALYRHVANKSDLLEGILDLVTSDADVTGHEDPDWRDWVCRAFVKMGEAMLRQRGVMALLSRTGSHGKSRTEVVEKIHHRLCDAGLDPGAAAQLEQDLYRYMLGTVALDAALPGDPGSVDHERHTRARLELLPSNEFPTVTRHATEIAHILADTGLEKGLRRIIDGFAREQGIRSRSRSEGAGGARR